MRVLGHGCAQWSTETTGGAFTLVCDCGVEFTTSSTGQTVDAFVAHVVCIVAIGRDPLTQGVGARRAPRAERQRDG